MPSEHNRRTVGSTRPERLASWGRADLHLHTTYSDGYFSPPKTIDIIAGHSSLDVIAITDHDTAEGAFVAQEYARRHHPRLEVIIGQEVTTGEGDVVGLFLKRTMPKFSTALEAIEAIHTQGGLAVAVHPFFWGWGMESVKTAILHLPFDAIEVRHGCPLSIPFNAITGLVNRWGQRLPALGGSDSHIPYTAGQAFTWFPGQTGADLRQAIETNTVRPGGTTWKVKSMLRKLPVLVEHRFSYPSKQALPRL
ncbi:MAG: CehA/McbA family metallohydrolase [Anaerolineaceae bacterium]|nr:CehA/McbA family metallohydrolase [Anaerolineaceae bacterium]